MNENLNQLVDAFVAFIPGLLGALLVLLIGWVIAKGVQKLVREGLRHAGLDRSVSESAAGNVISRITPSPAHAVGLLAFWTLFLGAVSIAVSVLGIEALNSVMGAIYSYLPNVIAAFAILIGAVVVSGALAGLVNRSMGDTPTGKMVAGIIPGIIFSMAIFMALNQLQIAPEIVTITYAALLGAIALGSALAFGLGGREVASRMLQQAYTSGTQRTAQAKHDLALGRQRARQMEVDTANEPQVETTPAVETPSSQPAGSPAPKFGDSVSPAPSFGESLNSFDKRRKKKRR